MNKSSALQKNQDEGETEVSSNPRLLSTKGNKPMAAQEMDELTNTDAQETEKRKLRLVEQQSIALPHHHSTADNPSSSKPQPTPSKFFTKLGIALAIGVFLIILFFASSSIGA